MMQEVDVKQGIIYSACVKLKSGIDVCGITVSAQNNPFMKSDASKRGQRDSPTYQPYH